MGMQNNGNPAATNGAQPMRPDLGKSSTHTHAHTKRSQMNMFSIYSFLFYSLCKTDHDANAIAAQPAEQWRGAPRRSGCSRPTSADQWQAQQH